MDLGQGLRGVHGAGSLVQRRRNVNKRLAFGSIRNLCNGVAIWSRVEQVLDVEAEKTNRKLVKLLLDKYLLVGHCAAMKRYLLLAQGDFEECFIDLADRELRKDATREVFRHNVRGIVDLAVRQFRCRILP